MVAVPRIHRTTVRSTNRPTVDHLQTPNDVSRDAKFKYIIRTLLGEQGIPLITNISFIYATVLLILILIVVGFLNATRHSADASTIGRLDHPAIMYKK